LWAARIKRLIDQGEHYFLSRWSRVGLNYR